MTESEIINQLSELGFNAKRQGYVKDYDDGFILIKFCDGYFQCHFYVNHVYYYRVYPKPCIQFDWQEIFNEFCYYKSQNKEN